MESRDTNNSHSSSSPTQRIRDFVLVLVEFLRENMAGREDYRIFVGGLGWNTSQRHLEEAFARYGKILDCLVMVDRETGRPRGFGFLTFADRRAMEDAIRDMHGRELDGKTISVNKAEPRVGAEDPYDSYGGDRRSGGRDSYRGDRLVDRSDECFKCGRPGHWARDCPSSGGGGGGGGGSARYSSHSEFGRAALHDRVIGGDRDFDRYARYYDRSGVGRYEGRERLDSRDGYGIRDRLSNERYPPNPIDDRYVSNDRYLDRYLQNGYDRDRDYERDGGLRGGDRYGTGGPTRYDRGNYRERAQPYDPSRRSNRR